LWLFLGLCDEICTLAIKIYKPGFNSVYWHGQGELLHILVAFRHLVVVLEFCILVIELNQLDDVGKLVLLHADIQKVDVQSDVDVLPHWVKAQIAGELDRLEEIAIAILKDLFLAWTEQLFKSLLPQFIGCQLPNKLDIVRLIVEAKFRDVENLV
jgi:hypothetical protein